MGRFYSSLRNPEGQPELRTNKIDLEGTGACVLELHYSEWVSVWNLESIKLEFKT